MNTVIDIIKSGVHVIAFFTGIEESENELFVLGRKGENEAFFATEKFSSNLMSEMNDEFQDWAMSMLHVLPHLTLGESESNNNFFNTIEKNIAIEHSVFSS